MYLAKKTINSNLPIYLALFKRLATGVTLDTQEEINEVIKVTKHISLGESDIYSARNDYFYLVSYLLSNGKDFLKKLDEESIDQNTYSEIAKILAKGNVPA